MFSIRSRDTDPFGQTPGSGRQTDHQTHGRQDTTRIAPIQATPFSDIISLIQVTTIMPGEKRFLIGTRSFKQGDRIPLNFRGKNITVEVTSVSSHQIEFRNLDNGETAALTLNLLPVGMTPGTDGITAPGMVPDNPNAPLELDASSLPSNAIPKHPLTRHHHESQPIHHPRRRSLHRRIAPRPEPVRRP